jgi:hypothetical protein
MDFVGALLVGMELARDAVCHYEPPQAPLHARSWLGVCRLRAPFRPRHIAQQRAALNKFIQQKLFLALPCWPFLQSFA